MKDIIQDLSRFNPNARVEEDVDIQGVSPETACRIETIGSEEAADRLEELESENENLDARCSELVTAITKIKECLEKGRLDIAKDVAARVL